MSLFLIPEAELHGTFLRKYRFSEEKLLNYQRPQLTQKLDINFAAEARKPSECSTQMIRQDATSKEILSIIGSTLPNYKNLIRIQFNKKTGHISIRMSVLSPQQIYFMVHNIRILPQLLIKVKSVLRKQDQNFVKVAFNPLNGQFKMQFPLYLGSESYFKGRISRSQSIIEYIYLNYVQVNLPLLKLIVNESKQQVRAQTYTKANSLDSAQRYLDIAHARSLITQSAHIQDQEILQVEKGRNLDLQQIVKNNIGLEQHFIKTCQLFEARFQLKSNGFAKKYHFQLSEDEQRYIGSRIAMPVQPKPKNTAQNLFILNYIYVYDLPSLKLRHIDEGGFSSIFLAQMKYICVYPTPGYDVLRLNQSDISNHKNILQKRIIVKKEEGECSFSRNQHQLKIIKSIKEPSVFLPKYYIPLNKPNAHSGAVFMDYIPFQTLTEFMSIYTRSSSLRSKLVLIFSVIQSLRFLRDQQVVHLDLKPSNIMIYHNLLVKLIDFGESYHPQICLKNHKPGFTIPYSPPEIFTNQIKQFTSKSDVFSLGVIMFEILYRSYPYDILEATELIDDIMQNYLKKWLFVPEEYERYGDVRILRMMNACISKCLSPAINQRPELDWLAMIVRCCIDYIE